MSITETESCHDHLNPINNTAHVQVHDEGKMENFHDSMKKLMEEIADHMNNAMMCVERCKWLIITPSCMLMTLLSWDVAGDEVGWDKSYWIPLMGVGVIIMIGLVDYFMSSISREQRACRRLTLIKKDHEKD